MVRKQGISLIVLVITIIVMVILAAAVVITISNTGIINKANQAVNDTNLKEVEQLATLTWAEEFMTGKRGDTLKTAVLDKLKDYTSKYNIDVTDEGITVTEKDGKSDLTPGLYKTGTNELIYSWENLINDRIIYVTDGAVYTVTTDTIITTLSGDLVLPNDGSIITIGYGTEDELIANGFYMCENITSITIPASVKSILNEAFCDCSKLKIINFEEGSKLELIEYDPFGRNEDLDITINYPGTIEEWEEIRSYSMWTTEDEVNNMGKVICSDGTLYIEIALGE